MRKSVNAQRRQNSAARIGALEGNVDSLVRLLSLVAKSPAFAATVETAVREDDSLAGYEQLLPHEHDQGRISASERGRTIAEQKESLC